MNTASTPTPHRVAIIHPWLPQYRVEFFETLVQTLAVRNIHLDVYHGETPPEWSARSDTSNAAVSTRLPTKFIKVGPKVLTLKSVSLVKSCGPYDLIVVEQAIRNLETYLFFLQRRNFRRIAMWGHGRTYTQSNSAAEEWLKRRITLRADWFFAYTDAGRTAQIECGFPTSRISVVQNSTDTATLRADIDATGNPQDGISSAEEEVTARALYIGGIDKAKRIDFLLECILQIKQAIPGFKIQFVGAGDDSETVRRFASTHSAWVDYSGPLFGPDKARALVSCDVILNPGRVGLVAVDSLVAGRPIVTTEFGYHAPEFEYLEPNVTCAVAADSQEAYIDTVIATLEPDRLASYQRNCVSEGTKYSVTNMVDRFAGGVMAALALNKK